MNLNIIKPFGETINSILKYMALWNMEVIFVRERFVGILDSELGVIRPDNPEEYYIINDCIKSRCYEKFYNEYSLIDRIVEFMFYDHNTTEKVFYRALKIIDEKLEGEDKPLIMEYLIESYQKHKVMEELTN